MPDYSFELVVNFLQSIYFVGFFFVFLGGKYSKKCNFIFLAVFIILHLTIRLS